MMEMVQFSHRVTYST